jgi:Ca2+-binding RTX toxin-like protein
MNTPLQQAVQTVTNTLRTFAQRSDFWTSFETAFGKNYDRTKATAIRQSLIDGTFTVPIQLSEQLHQRCGYVATQNTIYLRSDLIAEKNLPLITQSIMEGLGQAIDKQVNSVEVLGDEGAIFGLLAMGKTIDAKLLTELRSERGIDYLDIFDPKDLIEVSFVRGTSQNDSITGIYGSYAINAHGGNDTINAALGNSVDGGDGYDRVIADFSTGIYQLDTSTDLWYFNIEEFKLTGTKFSDRLRSAGNFFSPSDGSGADTLIGGAGNDFVDGASGKNHLDGGIGADTILGDGILLGGDGDDVISSQNESRIHYGGDRIASIGDINSYLNGGNGNDILIGGRGNDALYGGDGNDNLYGGDRNDTLIGGAGNDTFYGGNGIDLASYYGFSGITLTVDLANSANNTGDAFGDVLTEIENIQGSHTANNKLSGDTLNNYLVSYDGSDVLSGNDGNDILAAGKGNDTLNGDAENDHLYGQEGNDSLSGGDGVDVLRGGAGADVLNGGDGADLASYYDFVGASLTVDMSAVANNTGDAFGDRFINIENLQGSLNADNTLTGDGGNNAIYSYNGNDVLFGGTGNDSLISAAGDDMLIGGAGNDYLNGGIGMDNLNGGDGNDLLMGGEGSDVLYGGAGSDRFQFSHSTFSALGVDRIGDFNVAVDKIVLSKATFSVLSGTAIGSQFAIVANDAAVGASGAAIVYSQSTGDLFYNSNLALAGLGTGSRFADLRTGLALTVTNFLVIA